MNREPELIAKSPEEHGGLLVLALLALIVGAAAGVLGAIFRLALEQADHLRDAAVAWAQGERLTGFLLVTVRVAPQPASPRRQCEFSPYASGSGIHVSRAARKLPQARFA
jgi:CIC family chloride channel protein